MTDAASFTHELATLLAREGKRRIVAIATIFSVIALVALAVGVTLPKKYQAQSLIVVESKNVLSPLMEGRAINTGVSDEASIATQIMTSPRILREIMVFGRWPTPEGPRQEHQLLAKIAGRIRITSLRPDLIRVAYTDDDPKRCFEIAKKLAEIFIRESMGGRERDSEAAFEFIEREVHDYGAKLAQAHSEVLTYYATHESARSGARRPPRAAADRRGAQPSAEELAALYAEEAELAADAGTDDRAPQRRVERIEQLQRELDSLLTSFTENHPTVRRVREELRVVKEQKDQADQAAAGRDAKARAARVRLEQVRRKIAAAAVPQRASEAAAPEEVVDPTMRGVGQDSRLAELVRRYEATRDVYQDLLRRRETARVTMELAAEQRDRTLRVYEEPELPTIAMGMRLMHVVLIGLVLSALVPVALLYAFVRYDPRVRTARQIEQAALVPLLVTIPRSTTRSDRSRARRRTVLAGAMVACVFATYAVVFVVRLRGGS
jgi:polysaccharide chain length determinant protein (PEP-CTERM system associated)